MSLMSTPARHASWGPGPLMTLQVHVSQCQHRYIPQNQLKKDTDMGGGGLHLQAFLILVELFMQQRIPLGTDAFPTPGLIMKIFRSRGKIGLYSCPHPQTRSESLGFSTGHFQSIFRIFPEVPKQGPS